MTTSNVRSGTNADRHRANPMGAYVATAGALVLLISVWLPWAEYGPGDDAANNQSSGYEADPLIPWMAYLAVGMAIALLYATKRADRRQHRGLSLASFAAGLASLLWVVSYLIDPIANNHINELNIATSWGLWVGLLGALLWTVGSFLLAKEPEGDVEEDTYRATETHARPVETTRHAEVTETGPANVTDRDVVERHPTDTRYAGETHGTTGTYDDDLGTETRRRDEPGAF